MRNWSRASSRDWDTKNLLKRLRNLQRRQSRTCSESVGDRQGQKLWLIRRISCPTDAALEQNVLYVSRRYAPKLTFSLLQPDCSRRDPRPDFQTFRSSGRNSGRHARRWNRKSGGLASTSTLRSDHLYIATIRL